MYKFQSIYQKKSPKTKVSSVSLQVTKKKKINMQKTLYFYILITNHWKLKVKNAIPFIIALK